VARQSLLKDRPCNLCSPICGAGWKLESSVQAQSQTYKVPYARAKYSGPANLEFKILTVEENHRRWKDQEIAWTARLGGLKSSRQIQFYTDRLPPSISAVCAFQFIGAEGTGCLIGGFLLSSHTGIRPYVMSHRLHSAILKTGSDL
jgi:hypothetical protein